MRELQMTTAGFPLIGAPSAKINLWESIDWAPINNLVNRLQMRIAKATRESKYNKAKALQWLLTHSFSAKLVNAKLKCRLLSQVEMSCFIKVQLFHSAAKMRLADLISM